MSTSTSEDILSVDDVIDLNHDYYSSHDLNSIDDDELRLVHRDLVTPAPSVYNGEDDIIQKSMFRQRYAPFKVQQRPVSRGESVMLFKKINNGDEDVSFDLVSSELRDFIDTDSMSDDAFLFSTMNEPKKTPDTFHYQHKKSLESKGNIQVHDTNKSRQLPPESPKIHRASDYFVSTKKVQTPPRIRQPQGSTMTSFGRKQIDSSTQKKDTIVQPSSTPRMTRSQVLLSRPLGEEERNRRYLSRSFYEQVETPLKSSPKHFVDSNEYIFSKTTEAPPKLAAMPHDTNSNNKHAAFYGKYGTNDGASKQLASPTTIRRKAAHDDSLKASFKHYEFHEKNNSMTTSRFVAAPPGRQYTAMAEQSHQTQQRSSQNNSFDSDIRNRSLRQRFDTDNVNHKTLRHTSSAILEKSVRPQQLDAIESLNQNRLSRRYDHFDNHREQNQHENTRSSIRQYDSFENNHKSLSSPRLRTMSSFKTMQHQTTDEEVKDSAKQVLAYIRERRKSTLSDHPSTRTTSLETRQRQYDSLTLDFRSKFNLREGYHARISSTGNSSGVVSPNNSNRRFDLSSTSKTTTTRLPQRSLYH